MSSDVTAAGGYGRLPEPFTVPGSSSFSEFVGQVAPELLPGAASVAARGQPRGAARDDDRRAASSPAA